MISCARAGEIMRQDKPFLMQLSDSVFLMLVWIAVLLSIPFIAARSGTKRREPDDRPDFRVPQKHFLSESRGR
jgi:hypothetical protein